MNATAALRARVLFVSHSAAPAGAELKMLDLAQRLPNSSVLLLEDGPLLSACRARCIRAEAWSIGKAIGQVRTDSRILAGLAAAPDICRVVTRLARAYRRFDIVVAGSQKAMVLSSLACSIARVPLVWLLNDIVTAAHFSRAMRRMAVWLGNFGADRVVANSQAAADAFLNSGGQRDRTDVLHVGIDAVPFLRSVALPRSELGLPADAFLVGLFGRLSPWKGQHVLIQALASLPRDVHALLVGGTLFNTEGYAAQVRDKVAALDLADRVHFLGHRSDVPGLMASCDAIVHTSTEPEPFGRVIVEGMLSGRPVLATAAGGAVEIIRDDCGRLLPPDDAQALADAIRDLRADPPQAMRMACAGRRRALERFTVERMVEKLESILASVDRRAVFGLQGQGSA